MSDVIVCNICRYKSAQHKCDNCGFMSCSICFRSHVMNETCKLLQESPFHLCKTHDRLINGYCVICEELTCDQCLITTHVKHGIMCPADSAKLIKVKIIKFIEKLGIEDTKARSSINKLPDFNSHLLSLETKIGNHSSLWKGLISETEQCLLTYINEQRDMYEQYCTKRQIYIECIQKAKSSVADLDTFKCPLKIFSSWKKIFQEFKQHKTIKMPLYLSFTFKEMSRSDISNLFGTLIDNNDGRPLIADADKKGSNTDIAQCKLSNETANRNTTTLQQENTQLKIRVNRLRRLKVDENEYEEMKSEVIRLRNEMVLTLKEKKSLVIQNETLQKETARIKAKISILKKGATENSKLKDHMESIEKHNEQMKEEINRLENEVKETSKITEHEKTLQMETSRMKDEIARLKNEAEENLKVIEQVDTLEIENAVIRDENERLVKELSSMSGHNEHEKTLQMETARMKDEIARFKNEAEENLKVIDHTKSLQTHNEQMKAEITRLENEVQETSKLNNHTKSLQTHNEQMKAEITRLENEVQETSKLNKHKEDLETRNVLLNDDLSRLNYEVNEIREENKALSKENTQMKSEISELQTKLEDSCKIKHDLRNEHGIVLKTIDGIYDFCCERTLTKAVDSSTPSKNHDKIKYLERLQSIMNHIIEINNTLVQRERDIKNKCQRIEMLTKQEASSKKNKRENKKDKRLNEDWVHQNENLNSMLKERDEAISLLRTEKDDLQNRFSSIAGEKLTKGNPAIANLGDPNRPMKIGEKYGELYDNEWTDAMEYIPAARLLFPHLQQAEIDEVVVRHLCLILRCCYTECLIIAQEQLKSIVHTMQLDIDEKSIDLSNLPVCKDVAFFRRQNCAKFSNYLYKEKVLVAKISSANWDYSNQNGDLIRQLTKTEFFQKCVQLCWSMVIQDPAMYLDENLLPGTAYNKSMYKEFTESGDKVKFVVWPALFLHKDGPLLYKGVVQAYK